MTASVTRPPTVLPTIASPKSSPRKSAGSVRGSMQVMMYSPLNGRNGRDGVLRQTPLLANALLRSSSGARFDTVAPPSTFPHPDSTRFIPCLIARQSAGTGRDLAIAEPGGVRLLPPYRAGSLGTDPGLKLAATGRRWPGKALALWRGSGHPWTLAVAGDLTRFGPLYALHASSSMRAPATWRDLQ